MKLRKNEMKVRKNDFKLRRNWLVAPWVISNSSAENQNVADNVGDNLLLRTSKLAHMKLFHLIGTIENWQKEGLYRSVEIQPLGLGRLDRD